MASDRPLDWTEDSVTTRTGTRIPVRATARRPRWEDLPVGVQAHIEAATGALVVDTWSAGTGFTPGFASRLGLADGRRVFVKAASTADDRRHLWSLTNAYREEGRKLRALGPGTGAPGLLWHDEHEVDGELWVVLGLTYVDALPPRRPWRAEQLRLVLDKLADVAPALSTAPASLALPSVVDDLVVGFGERLQRIRDLAGNGPALDLALDPDPDPDPWIDTVEGL